MSFQRDNYGKWPISKFGELAEFKNGLNYRPNEKGHQVKILGVGDFLNKSKLIDTTILSEIPIEKNLKNDDFLKDGDLVFVRSNGNKALVGRCLLVFPNRQKVVFSGFTIRARLTSEKVSPFFISALMQFGLLKRILLREGRGTNISNLNQKILHDLNIPLPPIPEQNAIAELLSTWDTVIKKIERLIVVKEERYSFLVQSLISKNCDDWDHLKADTVFGTVSEKKNGQEELLSVTQDRGVIPRTMLNGRVMSPEGSTESYKLINKGDFAISLRSFQGGIEYSKYQGLISPAYTVLRPKMKLHTEYFKYFFKTYVFIEKYLSIAVIGIRDGKQISIPDFMTIKIPVPPIDQQKQIASILDTVRQELYLLEKQLEAYHKQKRGLMEKLLTGQWRVKTREG